MARDQNSIPIIKGVLNTDGSTVVDVKIDPTTHVLSVNNDAGGSDSGPVSAKRDQNSVTTLMAVSSEDDTTPVPLYVDSNGALLISSS